MSIHDIFHVMKYEMKQQSRSWIFCFFTLFSLIGIISCHVYWQGQGAVNWKMLALPCSMPLVNAYLYSVIQSLFLIMIIVDIPRRLNRTGVLECSWARPVNNTTFYWGIVCGNLALFCLINIIVILLSIIFINLTSIAPIGWSYYWFYLLTLTIPSCFFIAGLSLWVESISGSRFLGILLPVVVVIASLFWLPYLQHGTFDYLGSGIPNLFSEIVGHVNLSRYLLHRSIYLLIGVGLLAWGIKYMNRLPNLQKTPKIHPVYGMLFVLAGASCGILLEYSYSRDRSARADYLSSFERNWKEATCRIQTHNIRLRQQGYVLKVKSDLQVYNPGKQVLPQVVLFLNPGLQVMSIKTGKKILPYRRDQQFILIEQTLGAGEALPLHIEYEGEVDHRYCDLQLTDNEYEDTFQGERFFPTGRRGAFTRKDILLLTPASVWYPVAIPPVNPFIPLATGRDFTRFTLVVEHPLQKTVISQGTPKKAGNDIRFTCRNPLNGISLYAVNSKSYNILINKIFGFQINSTGLGRRLAPIFSRVNQQSLANLWKNPPMYWYDYKNFLTARWFEPEWPYLNVLEVPVSFNLSSHEGKSSTGFVEPGMVFFREQGFDLDMTEVIATGKIKNNDDLSSTYEVLQRRLFSGGIKQRGCHPLWDIGLQKGKNSYFNNSRANSLGVEQNIWVHSLKYPFMGKVFERLQAPANSLDRDRGRTGHFTKEKPFYDYFTGRTLQDLLSDTGTKNEVRNSAFSLKVQDLLARLTLCIPQQELQGHLDSLYRHGQGEIDYDVLSRMWSVRWGVNVDSVIIDWMTTKHEQYFKIRDNMIFYNSAANLSRIEGKIMNAGETGGIVSIEYGTLGKVDRVSQYLLPGEIKAFTLVARGNYAYLNMWLSTNRPNILLFNRGEAKGREQSWEEREEWRSITEKEFLASKNKNEFIADDRDPGFELVDGNLSWFQKLLKKDRPLRVMLQGGTTSRWEQVISTIAEGDSIRGFYCISGGKGKSTATWKVDLPKAGRYRVMGKVYRNFLVSGPGTPGGVIYHYTVFHGDQKENVEINLDAIFPGRSSIPTWASLGVFDFPAGEAKVLLSDKDSQQREDVAIVADAVKWVKIED